MYMVNRASIILTEAHLGTGIAIIIRDMVFNGDVLVIMHKLYRAHELHNAGIVSH